MFDSVNTDYSFLMQKMALAPFARDFWNPNGLSQTNPLLIGFNLGQGNVTDPSLVAQGNAAAYNYGASLMAQANLSASVNNLLNFESQIKEAIKSDKLSETQKQSLQSILDGITALKEKIKNNVNKQISTDEMRSYNEEIKSFIKSANETLSNIAEELKAQAAQEETAAEGATDTTEEGEASDSSSNTKSADKANKKAQSNAIKLCDRIEKSVRGLGTNYDDDENGIKNILTDEVNKDNVLDLFEAWNKTYKGQGIYSDGDDNTYGLIGTLMNDCEGAQKEEIAMLLINALVDKAEELGVDVSAEAAEAKLSTHSNWIGYRDDDKICKAVNALYNKVKAAAQKSKAKKVHDAELEKANNNAKAAAQKSEENAKIEKQKTQFRDDMREILGDDKAEISEKVKYENGQFVIRIAGKNYYGKDYVELANALEDAGLEPAKYLKKQSARAVA